MTIRKSIYNFLNPADASKKLYEEIKNHRTIIKNLMVEYKEEAKWRREYTGALSLLTESMDSFLWQKDKDNRYILANPLHCRSFFGFEGTKDCLIGILEKTDKELIKKYFLDYDIQNTFGETCLLSDEYVKDKKEIVHFMESGFVDGVKVLLYIIKIPKFQKGKLIGTMGIGWDFSERADFVEELLNKWINADETHQLYHNRVDSYCYAVKPDLHRCQMFNHICPISINNEILK